MDWALTINYFRGPTPPQNNNTHSLTDTHICKQTSSASSKPRARTRSTMSDTPADIIVDILIRLPVKCLLRFRCVSKQFLSIINSQDFVNRHLQFHSSRKKVIFQGTRSDIYLLDLSSVHNNDIPFENWQREDNIDVIGSCDGLLVIRNARLDSTGLFNVSTKKYSILPPCVVPPCMFLYDFCGYGFGRDPGSNDYKLVTILKSKVVTIVCVYSFEANSWKVIDSGPVYSRYKYGIWGNGAFVEGSLNWIGNYYMPEVDRIKYFILSYDLENETCPEVLVPDAIENYRQGSILTLKVWGGCLCLLYSYHDPNSSSIIDVWVMKEHGVKSSWVKMHSFSEQGIPVSLVEFPIRQVEFPFVSFYLNNEYRPTLGRSVFYYELENGRYEIKNENLPVCMRNAVDYVESLVWPS